MRHSDLPPEFAALEGKVQYINRVSSTEWSSSCPQCGGVAHKGGAFPDRFRMWTRAHGKNPVMGWCRRCGYLWFPDKAKPIDPQEFERWRREQLLIEEQRKRDAERAIEHLKSEKMWLQYNQMMSTWAREVVSAWGISEKWASHWRIGFNPDFIVKGKSGEYHSPAITIPLWQWGSEVPGNIKLRILNPRDSNDRYRNLYKVGRPFSFVAFNTLKADKLLLVEGEKKAMVVGSRMWERGVRDTQVVGLPTKTPNQEMVEALGRFKKITICLDPDAAEDQSLARLAEMLGTGSRVLNLPAKVDDMILDGLDIVDALKYTSEVK